MKQKEKTKFKRFSSFSFSFLFIFFLFSCFSSLLLGQPSRLAYPSPLISFGPKKGWAELCFYHFRPKLPRWLRYPVSPLLCIKRVEETYFYEKFSFFFFFLYSFFQDRNSLEKTFSLFWTFFFSTLCKQSSQKV